MWYCLFQALVTVSMSDWEHAMRVYVGVSKNQGPENRNQVAGLFLSGHHQKESPQFPET